MRLAAVGMVRNEIDLIHPFLRQCDALFDRTYLIDVQSTDGTTEAIRAMSAVTLFTTDRQERFQGPMMDRLSRRAFADGADWVFFLDADEFINIPSRAALHDYLAAYNADLMHLRWINLVPTRYGTFGRFDAAQEFHWSGRAAAHHKIALSQLFAAAHREYYVHEGNHHVSVRRDAKELPPRYGLPLLHVPIRSVQRLKYKNAAALRVTAQKHNRQEGEGAHIERIERLLAANIAEAELNHLAAHYSAPLEQRQLLDPVALAWPTKRLPNYIDPETLPTPPEQPIAEILLRDQALVWDRTPFAPHSLVAAIIDGDTVRVRPQPISGISRLRAPDFAPLGPAAPAPRSPLAALADAISRAFLPVTAQDSDPRALLIPALSALVAALRPRRYVELGADDGLAFFAACDSTAQCQTGTECVAIDRWIPDANEGPLSVPRFEAFKFHLGQTYPDQLYIQNHERSALTCFVDGSIDLLHIASARDRLGLAETFAAWLPKLTDRGAVLVSGADAADLAGRFPAAHIAGLTLLATGAAPAPLRAALEHAPLAQALLAPLANLRRDHADALARIATLEAQLAEQQHELARRDDLLRLKSSELDTVLASTAWRATAPLRKAMTYAKHRPKGG